MQLSDWFTLTTDRLGDPRFFARSPLRSRYFLANTLVLVMAIYFGVHVVRADWGRLPEFVAGWVGIAVAGMIMLWARALRDHRRIHRLYEAGELGEVRPGSPLDVALRVAATMTHLGLTFTFFLVGALLLQLARVLHVR